MKLFDIALKDLLRSFRSSFLLVMMFVAPLLITALLYFAFGRSGGEGFQLPVTRVRVANLDQADARSGLAAGRMLAEYLQSEEMSALLEVTIAADEAGARAAVEQQEADVAVIIPADLTVAAMDPKGTATVTLYHDPTLSIQPRIVRLVVGDYLDAFSGVTIALRVTAQGLVADGGMLDPATVELIQARYVAWVQTAGHTHEGDAPEHAILVTRSPARSKAPVDLISALLGPVLAGMVVFFAFFTGAAGASTLLYEAEEGTLARMFSTPTPRPTVLGGKFTAIVLTLAVQVPVLLLAGYFLFDIHWGRPGTVALVALGLVVAAAGFGVCLMSFVKTSRQSGPVMGAVVALTAVLGGLIPTGDPSQPGAFEKVSLFLPQGWAMRGLRLGLNGAAPAEIWLPVLILLAAGIALFAIGVIGFRRRYA
jgi:ABC-type multidrug transport system permease subunit